MANDLNFSLNENTLEKMKKKKDEMGFGNKSWNDWFKVLFDNNSIKKDTKQIIEDIFQKTSYEKWFDIWIKNFALNLENIWSGHSAKELTPLINEKSKKYPSGIVIGRGPSLKKNDHLTLLANSNFNGTIICSDGILKNALKAGVIPNMFEKFFVVTIDAQEIQLDLYDDPIIEKFGNKIKAIFSTTTSPKVIKRAQEIGMEIFWLHTLIDYDKGKLSFNHMSSLMTKCKKHFNGLPAIQTGANVGTACWTIAWSILKCSPVVLTGIDHSYLEETSWEEITKNHNLDKRINFQSELFKKAYPTGFNPEFNCNFKQTPQFQYYSSAFKEFIPLAPQWVKTINATEGGAIFGERIQCITFKKFLKE